MFVALTAAEVRSKAQAAGFTGSSLDMIVAIANRESGFNPTAYNGNVSTGDNSVGLTQINMIGSLGQSRLEEINRLFGAGLQTVDQAKEWLKNPDNNLRYAYYISNQGSNFQPWSTAGAAAADVGASGSSSSAGSTNVNYSDLITQYAALNEKWKALDAKVSPYDTNNQQTYFDPTQGLMALVPDGVDQFGQPNTQPIQIMTAAEYQEYISLGDQLDALEKQYEDQGGNLDDLIKQATYQYNTDPRNIDAQNAADKYARDLSAVNTAVSLAGDQVTAQHQSQNDAETSLTNWANSSARGTFRAPSTNLQSADDIFKNAVAKVKAQLPDVPARPYAPVVTLPDINRPKTLADAAAAQPQLTIFGTPLTDWSPGGTPAPLAPPPVKAKLPGDPGFGDGFQLPTPGNSAGVGGITGSILNSSVLKSKLGAAAAFAR